MVNTLLLSFLFAGALSAQNLVSNGDFSNDLASWTLGNHTMALVQSSGISTQDVAKIGASKCYSIKMQRTLAQPGITGSPYLEQLISVVAGKHYEVRYDIYGVSPTLMFQNDCGALAFINGNRAIQSGLHWTMVMNASFLKRRMQVASRYTATTTGSVTLRIYFDHNWTTGSSRAVDRATIYLDNVVVKETPGAIVRMDQHRRMGGRGGVLVHGDPNRQAFIQSSASLLSQPVQIPGWIGGYWLAAPAVDIAVLITNNNGEASTPGFSIPVFPSTVGFYLQVGTGGLTGVPTLGNPVYVNIHDGL